MTKGTKRILSRYIDHLSDRVSDLQTSHPAEDLTEYQQGIAGLRTKLGLPR